MGLGRIDKLHFLTWAYTKPTQASQCIVGALLVLGKATGDSDSQDSPQPKVGGSHHLPPYSILCPSPRGPHPNGILSKVGTPATLGAHNFACRPLIEMRSKAKLQALSRTFQWYVACHLHISKFGRFLTFSGRESNCQFDSWPLFWPHLVFQMSKWVTQANFRHLRFKSFPIT